MGFGIIGVERQRPVEARKRLLRAVMVVQRIATIVEGLEIIGRKRERLVIMPYRLLVPTERRLDRAGDVVQNFTIGKAG